MVCYISGPITGDPHYTEKFASAARQLEEKGYKVINPAALNLAITEGALRYEDYMSIDLKLVGMADTLVQLPGWEQSPGANRELGYAKALDLIIVQASVIGLTIEEGVE